MGFIGTALPAGAVWVLPIPQESFLRTPARLHLQFAAARRMNSRLVLQRHGLSDITLCDMQQRRHASAERSGYCALDLYFDASDLLSAPALKAERATFDIAGYLYVAR